MKVPLKLIKYPGGLLFPGLLLFLASIIVSWRAPTTIIMILLVLAGSYQFVRQHGNIQKDSRKLTFLLACCIFFVIQALSLLYANDMAAGLRGIEIKSAMVLIALAMCTGNYPAPRLYYPLMNSYCIMIGAAMLYCLLNAAYACFVLREGSNVFFYHTLVHPLHQHAVQVSILVFIALAYTAGMLNKDHHGRNNWGRLMLLLYYAGCLVMLSSKLVIIFSVACLVAYFIYALANKRFRSIPVLMVCAFCLGVVALVLFTPNPVNRRFRDIASGNISMIRQERFAPDYYFNGLQFRLLQWRFVAEILSEKHAWLTGIGIADAQNLLDQKYISTNMYVGEVAGKPAGYFGYNTHNQFLEALLQSGIAGLLAFVGICFTMLRLAMKRKNLVLSSLVILLLLYSFDEACLETQYSLVIFIFFPLFIYNGTQQMQVPQDPDDGKGSKSFQESSPAWGDKVVSR